MDHEEEKEKMKIRQTGFLICIILAAIMIVSVSSVCAQETYQYTKGRALTEAEIEVQKSLEPKLKSLLDDDNSVPLKQANRKSGLQKKSGDLPFHYDAREESYNDLIKVKDQQSTGLCWAFAATTVAERTFLHTGKQHASAKSGVELSPAHLGYFLYNRENDPLGNTAKDKNIILEQDEDYTSLGGNGLMTLQGLANWGGFALESKAPFNDGMTKSFNKALAYDDEIRITNAEILDSADDVKRSVYENGAVMIAMYYGWEHMDYDTSAYYDASGNEGNNHMVTVVGWDDSYKKENFNSSGSSWLKTPEHDGAWIVQNSYSQDWGDNGYFYISYDDKSLYNAISLDLESENQYDYNYQYDGNASLSSILVYDGDKMANIYEVKGSKKMQKLEAVGFTEWAGGITSYNIKIYTDITDPEDPLSGAESASFDVSAKGKGYHSFSVSAESEILLDPGSRYSIVVTMKDQTQFGVESTYSSQDISFEAGQEADQSFLFRQNPQIWMDLYSSESKSSYCARIKGYTTVTNKNASDVEKNIVRYAGDTRYETALKAADALKTSLEVKDFSSIIVADGNNYPDALAGSYLAKVKKAPLILVDRSVASEKMIGEYIEKNLSDEGTVYLLGGSDVVTERFEKSLKGIDVKRLAGDTRYETNLEILNEAKASKEDLLACTGEGFADSLSASAVGKPILLVDNRGLTKAQKTYLDKANVQDIYLIGGADVVSDKVGKELKSYDKDSKTERIAGDNRYKTSVAVAKAFFPDKCDTAVLAYGMKFPDGLAGGPLAISMGSPLLLVEDTAYADAKDYSQKTGINKLVVLGDTGVISDQTARAFFQ